MNICYYLPSVQLRPFVKNYLIIESQEDLINRVLPETSLVMAFRYKGQVSYMTHIHNTPLDISVISGLRKTERHISYAKGTGNILVIFREAGLNAFIKTPLYEFFNESISLKDIHSFKNLSEIEEQLAEANDDIIRIHLIEKFLIQNLSSSTQDHLILAAIEKIKQTKGRIKIKDLAGSLFISIDAFEKRFRKIIGVSPKQFAYIVRMRSIIQIGVNEHSLTEIALNAGYFDQSHFNKDFRLFTGRSPRDFFKSPRNW